MAIVTTNGDLGDAVYTLGILSQMPGGPHTYLMEPTDPDNFTATNRYEEGAVRLHALAKDLFNAQPYIKEFRMMVRGEDRPMWRSGGFRGAGLHRRNEPLMQAHLNHLNQVTGMGLKVDTSKPWISVIPARRAEGRVVVNRTARYTNRHFPWDRIVQHYGNLIAFIGLPHEHSAFCKDFGFVEHIPTRNLLEMARLIAGCELFIGNQSCANALAEGLKHPAIQETSLFIPDCIFKRDNAQHVWDGACLLPAVGDVPALSIRGKSLHTGLVSTMITPPKLWQFPGIAPQETYQQCEDMVLSLHDWRGRKRPEAMEAIKQYNLDRVPEFYRPRQDGETVRQAKVFAGY
jgi:hypothetical protein